MNEKLVELAKAAMHEAVNLHISLEGNRYNAWLKTPAKGRVKYEPTLDRVSLTDTFDDLLDAAVSKVREHAAK